MTERRTFPGGLRAQALIAMSLLLVLAFGSAGLVVERMVAQNLVRGARENGRQIAELVLDTRPEERAMEQMIDTSESIRGLRISENDQMLELGDWQRARDSGPYVVRVIRDEARCDIRLSSDYVESELRRTRELFWGFLGVGAIVILAFAYAMFTLLVIRPLRAIGVATERAAGGDLASPIGLLPSNEFGQVGRSFNVMLERLENQREELEKSLSNLETAHEELKDTQESLVRSEKLASVGQLAAGVAHEVGNPLAAVSGFNELLLEGELEPSERTELLQRSQVQLERIQEIIRSLLDFSREEGGVALGPVDVGDVIGESVRLATALPRARGKEIEVVLPQSVPPVSAVHAQLGQVVLNLLINALDAADGAEEPRVSVAVESSQGLVVIAVEDNGPGVPEEVGNRIFDPFFTTKEPGSGTGLGLAVSSRIVDGFSGELRLARNLPSRFEISLPVWDG